MRDATTYSNPFQNNRGKQWKDIKETVVKYNIVETDESEEASSEASDDVEVVDVAEATEVAAEEGVAGEE